MAQLPTAYDPTFGEDIDPDDYFQDPEDELRSKSKWALIAVGALALVLILMATVVQIGGAVIGTGEVEVASKIKRISHPTGGVVNELLVSDGDRVKKGDVLMRLDTTVSGVSAELSSEGVDQLLARKARLEAEREGRATVSFPKELAARSDASAQEAMAQERRVFQLKRSERAGLRAQLADRIRQLNSQIVSYQQQISAIRQQQALIEPERDSVRQLWEDKLVTINRLNQLERTAVDLEGSAASLGANIAQVRSRISETREQMISLDQTARADAGEELAQVESALNEQTVRKVSAGDQYERSTIRAPYDGVVDKLQFTTIGSFVPPAEQIMEIVPDSDQLLVEGQISPADIDQIRVGQKARVRFTAFNLQTTPEFPGRVEFVSAERASDERTGLSFYRVRIAIDQSAIEEEYSLELVPGMPTEIYIETGDRSIMSYITKPLMDQISRAFRN